MSKLINNSCNTTSNQHGRSDRRVWDVRKERVIIITGDVRCYSLVLRPERTSSPPTQPTIIVLRLVDGGLLLLPQQVESRVGFTLRRARKNNTKKRQCLGSTDDERANGSSTNDVDATATRTSPILRVRARAHRVEPSLANENSHHAARQTSPRAWTTTDDARARFVGGGSTKNPKSSKRV
jgi:hypothetical protein